MDETYAGGNVEGKGHGYKGNKVVVVDTMQRGENICLQVVRGTDRETLHGFILEKTVSVTEAIYTAEWPAYKSIEDKDTKQPRQ